MLDSLYIAATGMNAQQMNIDTISNNLANVNTAAFKKDRINFSDLMVQGTLRANALLGAAPGAARGGAGVAVGATDKVFNDGAFNQTSQTYDLAIHGAGMLEVELPDGTQAYTRAGSLRLDKDGFLTTADGQRVMPAIQIPTDATNVAIDSTGKITAQVPDETDPIDIGQIELATFVNPGALKPLSNNLYTATDQSGEAVTGHAGDPKFGTLQQGFLEASNVSLNDEFVNLVMAQRVYEVNSKAIQASDEMMSIVNNLRK